ncbi:LiaI-LiaF-like domain-containing protein [Candidatus Aciduliprofundum boonei]|uniref:LiaI-LiaF-like transmembrane region domain-containing protein n=1 Tax=Aciduliprofundum boonei (strain DSM 19572 / T469) TaxID=439481 RepID=B5IEW4_ACIB4|nr:DUF5668 domain-containing protein [Candidatus Aciduliprofundum boonei]ADD07987.1 hypothetical protein Aboo_0175 [Aciduliprofundum boonei T469]EDY35183.1 hypothetical protein ABOONEI_254 [Aciduliprofundum boonei T469]HII55144.1 hypothetical protein [Candidatus Aciduliprofundum boonei]
MRYKGYMSVGAVLGGVFLIIIGVLWLLEMLGIIKFNVCIIGPILLIIAGIALILKDGWHSW